MTPTRGKSPIHEDWTNLRLTEKQIRSSFTEERNVGVILGASGLADLDFDDPAAVKAWSVLAPTELDGAARFEHAGRPHLIFQCNIKTRQFRRRNRTMLLEMRGDGAQTLFPPSIHPDDGQPYVWIRDVEPPKVSGDLLVGIATRIATVAYASEFWTEGSRHDLALALAGFLARRIPGNEVYAIVRAVATVAGDAEIGDREGGVSTTIERVGNGEPATGLPTLDELAPDLAKALASWWGSDVRVEAFEEGCGGRQSHADLLVEIGRSATLFHDRAGAGFARIPADRHQEIWPLKSRSFRNWLRLSFFNRLSKTPGTDAINSALGLLEGFASFGGQAYELNNRVAAQDGAIYYDLADRGWRAVRISADGWDVVDTPPILFRRYSHQLPQVAPVRGGHVEEVLDFLNVRAADRLLLLVWLVSSLVPDIPHPIPDFHGEKGAGKSVGQRVLRRVVDPSQIETLAFPTDVRELIQQLSHHYAPVYDNVDNLPPWVSDIICRAITGQGFSKRELYSDDEDVIYSYRRVILLNGINVVARRPDLLDRSILIGLDRIDKQARREEALLWQEFEGGLPSILGAIFDTIASALQIYPRLELPHLERMADFTRWGAAISEALGYGSEAFLSAYSANLGIQTREAVEGHIVGAAILALLHDCDHWSGTPTELLAALEDAAVESKLFKRTMSGKIEAKGWPGGPQILGRRLNEVRSNLRDLGYELSQARDGERTVNIHKVTPQSCQNSAGDAGNVEMHLEDGAKTDDTDATDAGSPELGGELWEALVE